MAPKFAVGRIVRDHYETFADVHGKVLYADYVWMLGVPVGLGALAAGFGAQLRDVGQVVAGVSILSGLLFGLLVYVFQLRLQLSSDPRVNPLGNTIKLIEQLFSNIAYAVVAGLVSVVFLVACANLAHPFAEGGPDLINRWYSGGVVAVGAHLLLTIFMCLKRTKTAFDSLIKERVGAPVPAPTPTGQPPVSAPR